MFLRYVEFNKTSTHFPNMIHLSVEMQLYLLQVD